MLEPSSWLASGGILDMHWYQPFQSHIEVSCLHESERNIVESMRAIMAQRKHTLDAPAPAIGYYHVKPDTRLMVGMTRERKRREGEARALTSALSLSFNVNPTPAPFFVLSLSISLVAIPLLINTTSLSHTLNLDP